MENGDSLTVEERLACLQALRKVGDGYDLVVHLPQIEKGVQSGLLTQRMKYAALKRYNEVSESESARRDRERGVICWLPACCFSRY